MLDRSATSVGLFAQSGLVAFAVPRRVLATAGGALCLLPICTFLACALKRLVTLRTVFVRFRHGGSEIGFEFIDGRGYPLARCG